MPSTQVSNATSQERDGASLLRGFKVLTGHREPTLPTWVRRRLRRATPLWEGQAVAIVGVGLAALLRLALEPVWRDGAPFVIFFGPVAFAAAWGGVWAGLSASALSTIAASLLFLANLSPLDSPSASTRTIVFWIGCGLIVAVAAMVRNLVRALLRSEEQAQILAQEMRHRVSNVLGMILAITRQSARSATTVAEFQFVLENRLVALGRAQEGLLSDAAPPPDLGDLIALILEPFDATRFSFNGPRVEAPHELASTLALLFHELATNATKYGALSTAEGAVLIEWVSRESLVNLNWRESGGPSVAAPSRRGFGSRLMESAFPEGKGQVCVEYESSGLRCQIQFPVPTPS
jgi:two-component sensor histidine kinase